MAILIFRQGDDVILKADVFDAGVPVDLSSAPEVRVILMWNGIEQFKYSTISQSGYGLARIVGVNNNEVEIVVEREQSMGFCVGLLYAIVLAKTVDPNFPDNEKTKEFQIRVGKVIAGSGKDENI